MTRAKRGAGKTTLHIELSKDLVQHVDGVLKARGSDITTYIRLQLRAFKTSKTHLSLEDKMPFGKYAGEVVEDICRADTAYMDWLVGNANNAKFDVGVLELLAKLAEVK